MLANNKQTGTKFYESIKNGAFQIQIILKSLIYQLFTYIEKNSESLYIISKEYSDSDSPFLLQKFLS